VEAAIALRWFDQVCTAIQSNDFGRVKPEQSAGLRAVIGCVPPRVASASSTTANRRINVVEIESQTVPRASPRLATWLRLSDVRGPPDAQEPPAIARRQLLS